MAFGFCLSPQVITGIWTLSGVILGSATTYFVGKLDKKREASNKLRAAFAPELANMRLSAHKGIDIEKMLTEAFPKHSAAIEEFSFYVPKRKRESYFKAWEEYYIYGGSIRFTNYLDIKVTVVGEVQSKMNNRDRFEEKVGAILKFAEPK